ncbi:DUF6777 domain-containing protein [Streptomyces purpureus]|uniref:DUF6777 domain-containing protein n=1 Tax=Streptomyces purpureus TaxID=1951 RepID=A0A918H171_9ACTN|nr:hypothetical protein GCM10014713_24230 [Streptomyces purpureus]
MTSEPPSGRPTGPPSGPLSGPAGSSSGPGQAGPPPPPSPPGGRGGPSGPGGEGGREGPWWRSVPKVAALTAVIVAAVALTVVLTRSDGGGGGGAAGGGGEVFLEAAAAEGSDPYTKSTVDENAVPQSPAPIPSPTQGGTNTTRGVTGSSPGLYGGTRNVASCDVERQVGYLDAEPAKKASFASVLGLQPDAVAGYLRGLTPVQLRYDTRVTNHGYRDGRANAYQAVLQAGTAVLVDSRGVPRVRCACGNPLKEPVAQANPQPKGAAWPAYRPAGTVFVRPSATVVKVFVIYDQKNREWVARERGDQGKKDKETRPPKQPPIPASPMPPNTVGPAPCVTVTGNGEYTGTAMPCPPTTRTPAPKSPDTASPDTRSPEPRSPGPRSPEPPSPDTGPPTEPDTVSPEPDTQNGSPATETADSPPPPDSPEEAPPSPLSPAPPN